MRRPDVNYDPVAYYENYMAEETSTSTFSSDVTLQQGTTPLLHNLSWTIGTNELTPDNTTRGTLLRDAPFALPFMAGVGVSLPIIVCLVYCIIRYRKKKRRCNLHMMSLYQHSRHARDRPAFSRLTRSSSMDHVYFDLDRDTLPGEHLLPDDAAIYSLPEDYSRTTVQPRLHTQSFIETNRASLCWPSVGIRETLKKPMLPMHKSGKTSGPATRWPSVINPDTINEPILHMRNFIKAVCADSKDKTSVQEDSTWTPFESLQFSSQTLPLPNSSKVSHLRMRAMRESNLGHSITTISECCAESTLKFSTSSMQRGVDEFTNHIETDERDSAYTYTNIYPKESRDCSNIKSKVDKRDLRHHASLDCVYSHTGCFQDSQTCNTDIDTYVCMGKSNYPKSDQTDDAKVLTTYTNATDFSDAQYVNTLTHTTSTRATDEPTDKHGPYQNSKKLSNVNLTDNGTFNNDAASSKYDDMSDANLNEDPSHYKGKQENDSEDQYLIMSNASKGRNVLPSFGSNASVDDSNANHDPSGQACESESDDGYDYVSDTGQDKIYLHPVFDFRNGRSDESLEYIHPLHEPCSPCKGGGKQ